MATIEPGSPAAGLLASARLGWLATVRPDGQPQSSYVWFHFGGTDLMIASQPGAAKLRLVAGEDCELMRSSMC
ncbi:MAG TPA: pyridoxamine 5'-phosphate oxidase family protein [Streptosporangiaceae bacterium]|jgi:hypothetical protein